MIAALLLTLAQPVAPPPPERQAQIVRHLDTILFDGESARFRWPAGRHNYYCGWVNAKNRLGAYVGWRLFLAIFDSSGSVDRVMIQVPGDDGFETYVVTQSCRNSPGLDINRPPTD